MAVININDKEQQQKIVTDIGLRAAAAAQGAQRMTNLKIKSVLLTGEDIANIKDALLPLCGDDGRLNMYMYGDWKVLDEITKNDEPFAILVVGADASSSSLGWNCGACGFKTCGEFNKFSKENAGRGTAQGGPCCMWQLVDFGGAVCSAGASVYESGLPTRVHTSFGSMSCALGYIDTPQALGISIGPWKYSTWDEWYNRPRMKGTFNMSDVKSDLMRCYPTLFAGFNGRGRPVAKTDANFTANGIYFGAEFDEEYENKRKAAGAKFAQNAAEIRAKIAARKEKKDK